MSNNKFKILTVDTDIKAQRRLSELLTGEEALSGMCTVTDGTLQTAVQFFRSMLCV